MKPKKRLWKAGDTMEAMESAMGLGFVLEFKDMASSGIEKAKVKIDELKQHTSDLTSVFDKNLTRIKNGCWFYYHGIYANSNDECCSGAV